MTSPDTSSLLLAAGTVLAVAGLLWRRVSRSRDRRQVRRSLEVALDAGDAAMRSSAIAAAGAQGVSLFADYPIERLAERTDVEDGSDVRVFVEPAGWRVEILATDPGATKDFQHFCQTTGCELLEASEEPGGVLRFRLKKPG